MSASRTLPQSRVVVLRGASHQDSNCIVPLTAR